MVMSKKNKHIKEQKVVAEQQKEAELNNALQFSRKRFKRFDEVIMHLYEGADLRAFFADRRIWKVNECFTSLSFKTNLKARAKFRDMLVHLSKTTFLLSGEETIQAVINMFRFQNYWEKDVLTWKPESKRRAEQLKELAFYLFCKYEVPEFMYKSFYERSNVLFIKWFIHLGSGKKARELEDMPIAFTQKMAHYFLQAPSNFNIPEALRWAQVKGLMGDDKLAKRLAYSWLGTKQYENEDFWESFIRILVNAGMFDQDGLTELIDYVRQTKALNEDYSLKGRTLRSLFRQSEEWHNHQIEIRGAQIWKLSGLKGYDKKREQELITMEELTGSKLLLDEGRIMKHCVASYVQKCVSEKTAIFSMRKYTAGLLYEVMATIEVDLSWKRVVQAKARLNRKISDEAMKHLERWADINHLSISPYL